MDLNELGLLAIGNGDYQEAVNIFRKALAKHRLPVSFIGLGKAYYCLGDLPTARWAFYKALELDQSNKEAYVYLARVEEGLKRKPASADRGSFFRVGKHYLEELRDGKWCRFFVKGINMGLGIPGYFPGEYPIHKGTYLKWFRQISGLGINSLRVYTVHPPSFYEAIAQFNQSGEKLYLFQGTWLELPEDYDFLAKKYMDYVRRIITEAVDVIYGAADLPERPGYAHGRYECDVSRYTAAFIIGREWETCAVKAFNTRSPGLTHNYHGNFLRVSGGTAFEAWITQLCDFHQEYEYKKYAYSHPVSVVDWPTLDPLSHPSESNIEDELLRQGIRVAKNVCNENEDMESLDTAKIRSDRGNGFFATYHVYPYYPDFMNYDYVSEPYAYTAYLRALKGHHGDQPVLIAEFGIPSSREITHWQKDGLHHGGHDEKAQGEGNGRLMQSIYRTGMAGGMLFGWFDEWFKRNWLFLPYELPADRKPFWYNLQDAEENYGLLAAYPGYPGKLVTLSGKREEWSAASTLYEKKDTSPAYRFNDGFDDRRALKRLLVQHDEGFLYLLLETEGPVDMKKAGYIIALDTCCSREGEFLLPLGTNRKSPVGLKFAIHISGETESRILVCKGYDKYLNQYGGKICPGLSDKGEWVVMQNRTNSRRISKDGARFFPSRVHTMSGLKFGSLDEKNPRFDSLADFHVSGNIVEIRLPWGLLNFTDPSSGIVLWQEGGEKTRKTDGVRFMVVSFKPEDGCLRARETGRGENCTDTLPVEFTAENVAKYSWEEWNVPIYHTYLKQGYRLFRNTLAGMPDEI